MQQLELRSPKSLFERYLKDFQSIGLCWCDGNLAWTQKNLQYFAKLGEDLSYDVYSQHAKRHEEYLIDLCWIKSNEEGYWIELALEEEG